MPEPQTETRLVCDTRGCIGKPDHDGGHTITADATMADWWMDYLPTERWNEMVEMQEAVVAEARDAALDEAKAKIRTQLPREEGPFTDGLYWAMEAIDSLPRNGRALKERDG